MALIEFDVLGEDVAAEHLAAMGERAALMQPAFTAIRALIQAGFAQQFQSHGAFFGAPWAPLAPATVEAKGSSEVLEASGAMRRALEGGPGRRSRVGRSSLRVGVGLFYARFAQAGTKRGEPARPVVGIAARDTEESISIMQRYIVHGLA